MKLPDDPFIQELLPEFVETWLSDIDSQYSDLVNTKNGDDLYRMAHTLKGSCFQFGLDDVANMGIALMGLAKDKDWGRAMAMKIPIRNAFAEVKQFLDENPIVPNS